ncbi:MAG: glycosyltransferase family 4 protein [Lysobacter sp.]|nr:glycosyltransferase family 4 protein [Lysobacter sp.]
MALWLSFHLVIGLLGTWWARRYALNANLLDHPGERRSHDAAIPRGGGIAIVASLLIAALWLAIQSPDRQIWLSCFATGLAVVAGVGWVDDHRPLSASARLAAHVIAAAVLAWGLQLTYGNPFLSLGTFVLAVGLTNTWNFMDGIDGLAASQAGLIAATIALALPGPEQWLAAALAAACGGFLPFNFPKAKVFLGDVGSGAIGFAIAALVSSVVAGQQTSSGLLILLPLAAFLVDASLTLATRMLRGEQWWRAHADHSYQMWARKLRAHRPVTLAYAVWTTMACVFWLTFRKNEFAFITLSLLAWYMATTLLWLYLRRLSTDAPSGIRG